MTQKFQSQNRAKLIYSDGNQKVVAWGGSGDWLENSMSALSWVKDMFYIFFWLVVIWVYTIAKMHQTEQLSVKITYNFEQKNSDKTQHILYASICFQIEIKLFREAFSNIKWWKQSKIWITIKGKRGALPRLQGSGHWGAVIGQAARVSVGWWWYSASWLGWQVYESSLFKNLLSCTFTSCTFLYVYYISQIRSFKNVF